LIQFEAEKREEIVSPLHPHEDVQLGYHKPNKQQIKLPAYHIPLGNINQRNV
jgi:hypothetical protein